MPAMQKALMLAALGATFALGVAGCAMERPATVPASAMVVTEGNGRISYRAPADGTVYVYDEGRNRLVYTGKVEKGELLEIDPRDNRLTIDGKVRAEKILDGGARHRVFFDRSGKTVERVEVERETRIETQRD